jgi:hypothetical protein
MAVLLGVVAIAAIVAGCGSDDDGGSTVSLTKAEFTRQANAICKKGVEDIQKELEIFAKSGAVEQGASGTALAAQVSEEIVIPNFKIQIEDLQELGVPKGDDGEVTAFLAEFEQGIEDAEADPKSTFRGDPTSFTKTSEMAADYGLEFCGRP